MATSPAAHRHRTCTSGSWIWRWRTRRTRRAVGVVEPDDLRRVERRQPHGRPTGLGVQAHQRLFDRRVLGDQPSHDVLTMVPAHRVQQRVVGNVHDTQRPTEALPTRIEALVDRPPTRPQRVAAVRRDDDGRQEAQLRGFDRPTQVGVPVEARRRPVGRVVDHRDRPTGSRQLTDGVDRQRAELVRQRPMLLLVEVLVASEHDLVLGDQVAEVLDVAARQWDREVEPVDDGADRAGEALDVETAGRRGDDAAFRPEGDGAWDAPEDERRHRTTASTCRHRRRGHTDAHRTIDQNSATIGRSPTRTFGRSRLVLGPRTLVE